MKVVIVGAGIAGCYLARLLEGEGITLMSMNGEIMAPHADAANSINSTIF